jgi:hypothetical protein
MDQAELLAKQPFSDSAEAASAQSGLAIAGVVRVTSRA